jgi:hypothetical protein
MAAPTNTFLTTAAIGNREDLSDVIYRITPTVTPFLSMASKSKATNTLHEWQVQDLASAANNAQAEGDTLAAKVVTPTVRLNNRTQISAKAVVVSGTQQALNQAGVRDQMSYQLAQISLELKRDLETGLTQNSVTATSPRQSRGLTGWISDNVDAGVGYVASNYVTNVAQTDGTQRAFTEAQLKNVLQKVFTAGGEPDTILVGPSQKQTFSTFSGNSTRFDKGEDSKLYAAIDIYVSDFGTLKIMPSRFQRSRDAFVLTSDKVAVAYLRPFQTIELATTGDAQQREVVVEYCLEARAPKAHGAVLDLL